MNSSNLGGQWAQLVGKGDSAWAIERRASGGQVSFTTFAPQSDGLVSTSSLADGQWHHVAAVYDGARKFLFVDGVLEASKAYAGTIRTNDLPVQLGLNAEFPQGQYDGRLDDLRIYDRALSGDEVRADMAVSPGGSDPGEPTDTTAPSIPVGLSASAVSQTRIDLTWSPSSDDVGVTGYVVRRNGVAVGAPTGTGFSDTGLAVETLYTYTVSARDAAGNESAPSSSVSLRIPDTSAPTVPTGLSATVLSISRIRLDWTAATDNLGVVGYRVRRNGAVVGTPGGTSFTDLGLSIGPVYSYTVSALDAAGNESAASSAVEASIEDTSAPTVPAGLTATQRSDTEVDLTWSAATDDVGVSSYVVRRNGVQVGTPVTPSFTDQGLTIGPLYSYAVAARDAAGNESAPSTPVGITLADLTAPTVPAGLTATVRSSSAIDLAWNAASDNVDVVGYVLRRDGNPIGTPSGTAYSDGGLDPDTSYLYAVSALDAAGNESAASTGVSARTRTAEVFPLRVEAGKRYLVDASGDPFLLHGDTAWSLMAAASKADAELYLEDRRRKGFNTILVSLIEHLFAPDPPNNADGDPPFTTSGDYRTPNEAYFAHADWVIQRAAEKGMLVLLVPSYMGYNGGDQGWYQEMLANGDARMRDYGRYLGQRYAAHDNILWTHGGDYDPPVRALAREIALGIREFDPDALHTVHGAPETHILDYWDIATETWIGVNNVYTFKEVFAPCLEEYERPGEMPFFLIESRYEGEHLPTGNDQRVRMEAYQARLSGASGSVFGNSPVWAFDGPPLHPISPSDWKLWLDSPGARSMPHVQDLFNAHSWWTLEPDPDNELLVGGLSSGLDRAVAARDAAGAFALAYMPSARTITLDLSKLAGPDVEARWYDPTTGQFSPVVGSPFPASGTRTFTPAGDNASGWDDWVLELVSK